MLYAGFTGAETPLVADSPMSPANPHSKDRKPNQRNQYPHRHRDDADRVSNGHQAIAHLGHTDLDSEGCSEYYVRETENADAEQDRIEGNRREYARSNCPGRRQ